METEANEKNTEQQYCVPANASCLCPVTAQRVIQNSVTGVNESPEQKSQEGRNTETPRWGDLTSSEGVKEIFILKKITNINTQIK